MNVNWTRNNLYSQLYRMYKNGTSPVKMQHCESEYGDEYYSESEYSFRFEIGSNKYVVGYWNRIEDAPDWAQAEAFNGDIFMKNGSHVSWNVIVEDLQNYQQIERDSTLNKLLND